MTSKEAISLWDNLPPAVFTVAATTLKCYKVMQLFIAVYYTVQIVPYVTDVLMDLVRQQIKWKSHACMLIYIMCSVLCSIFETLVLVDLKIELEYW